MGSKDKFVRAASHDLRNDLYRCIVFWGQISLIHRLDHHFTIKPNVWSVELIDATKELLKSIPEMEVCIALERRRDELVLH